MASEKQSVLVIGGTGAQGAAVVKHLSLTGLYTIKVLTRTSASSAALSLAALPGVTILEGDAYNEATLHSAFGRTSLAYINTNGFAVGEKAEIYWGTRIFEIAAEEKVRHLIWANLESSYKISGFQPQYRAGHFEGKDKVADWMSAQGTQGMRWSVLTSCMYLEMLAELLAPFREVEHGEEVFVFKAPVGGGMPPMIYLEDLGRYASWLFANPERASGMNLKIATAQVGWEDVAKSFTEVTGRKARFEDLSLDEYFQLPLFPSPDAKVGHGTDGEDPTLQTYRENFSGFWNTWRDDILVRDYELLDEILPGRVRSVGEWMRVTGYSGEKASVLKDYRDTPRK